ncbi:MAG: nucleotide-binding protein [Deltaproteobacteria bacterium]|nr:nucleotide-binding protein [Deltaproteobacteria bacterium]
MRQLFIASALAASVFACNKSPSPPATPPTNQAASGPAKSQDAPPPPADAPSDVRGKVVERLEAPPYTYLKLATASGEAWAAVPETTTGVGTEVTVAGAQPMRAFASKTLNRTFELVYFGTLVGAPGQAQPAAPASQPAAEAMPAADGAKHAAGGPPAVVGKIQKAGGPDGKSIEEIFAGKANLKDKNVSVNGQVTKFVRGVMGRNWVHIQDGTGAADKGTHDLTVTTQGETKVGDVVSVKGVLRADRDFGAGYAYSIIIEEATLGSP